MFCPHRYYQLSNYGDPADAVCINDSRCVPGGRCNYKHDCSYGEGEYWCPRTQNSEDLIHRYEKQLQKDNHTIFDQQTYPSFQPTTKTIPILPEPLLSNSIRMTRNLQNSDMKFSFWCNK